MHYANAVLVMRLGFRLLPCLYLGLTARSMVLYTYMHSYML